MTKHIHCDLIKAWADGADIEFWDIYENKWEPCANPPIWHTNTKYRIAKNKINVRFAIIKENDEYRIFTCYTAMEGSAVERSEKFVRWHSDWTEVEI